MSTSPQNPTRNGLVRREFLGLAALGFIAAAALGFGLIASAAGSGGPRWFDEAIMKALRTPGNPADPIGPWWVEAMFRDLTALGGTTVLTLVTVLVAGYLAVERKFAASGLVIASIASGTVLSTVLKNLFERPRPELVGHLVDVRSYSFPSGHAMLSAVTYLTLGALVMRVSARRSARIYVLTMAALVTALIGISRVYLGVHYPTDVLAGWTAGSASALLCWTIALWLQRRGAIEEPEASPPRA